MANPDSLDLWYKQGTFNYLRIYGDSRENPISGLLCVEEGSVATIDEIDVVGVPYKTLIDDYTTTDKTYIGKTKAGNGEGTSLWQIKCLDDSGNFLKIEFADGVDTFTKEWDLRTSYTYS